MEYSKLVVFDLDHTLLQPNCSHRFGIFLFQRKLLPRTKLLYAMCHYLLHRCSVLSTRSLHCNIFHACFQGLSFQYLDQQVQQFLQQYFNSLLYMPMLMRLQSALGAGYYTLLLSSSPDFLVTPIAKRLGLHQWSATTYLSDSTGELKEVGTVLDGAAKAVYVANCAKKLGVKQHEICAYTDSHLDLPLLESVGQPIAVNPDATLLKICRKNCWEILSDF